MNVSGVLLYTAAMVIAGHGEENVIFVSIQKSNHMKAFIAFGINSAESPIDIRTAPRWCPLKQNDDLQHPEP